MKAGGQADPALPSGTVYGVRFPARVVVTTEDEGSFLVDMTGDGMSIVRDGSDLFLTVRAPIVMMSTSARDALVAKGVIDP